MQVKIEESWRSQLQEEFDKPYFARLAAFVREEYRTQRVCPVNGDLFRVFNLCPFDRVRVVILGQDPYPDPRFYYGICFSVPDGVPIPGSLQNIFREVHDDTGRPVPASGRLERWVAQGVLSMNTIFTTRAFRSGSHRGRGWEEFSGAVIRRLNERRDHLVFLLWGAAAQQKAALIDPERHLVLTAAHPSPRSADRGEGCAAVSTRWRSGSISAAFCCAAAPQSRKTRWSRRSLRRRITAPENSSHPRPRCDPLRKARVVKIVFIDRTPCATQRSSRPDAGTGRPVSSCTSRKMFCSEPGIGTPSGTEKQIP